MSRFFLMEKPIVQYNWMLINHMWLSRNQNIICNKTFPKRPIQSHTHMQNGEKKIKIPNLATKKIIIIILSVT